MPTEQALEVLSTAWSAHLLATGAVKAGDLSNGAVINCINAQNHLFDACLACGMPYDGDETEFAAATVTAWLVGA